MECSQPRRRRQWVSLPRVARRLHLSGEAALALIKSGELPAILIGGARWFVLLEDLDAFQARRHRPDGPDGRAA